MKNNKVLTLVSAVAVVIFSLSSCTKDTTVKHIPQNAFAVAVLDGKKLIELSDNDRLLQNEQFLEFKEGFKNEFEKSLKIIEEIIEKPEKSGILLNRNIYIFACLVEDKPVFGLLIPFHKQVFEKNLKIFGEDFGFPVEMMFQKKNNISYFQPDMNSIISFNENLLVVLLNRSSKNTLDILESYYYPENNKSILNNNDFKRFYDNMKHINLWIASDVIDDVGYYKNEIEEFYQLTGMDLSNNYGHLHIEFKEREIVSTQKFRYNETIQNLNFEKIAVNYEKLTDLFLPQINTITDLLGLSKPEPDEFDMDEWSKFDWDTYEWSDMSEEELERELELLIKQIEEGL